jgi:hypothetical protein
MKIEQKIDELYIQHISKYSEEPTLILMSENTEYQLRKNFMYLFGVNPQEVHSPTYYRGMQIYRTKDLKDNQVLVK